MSQHLRTLPTGIKVAVLCDLGISARQLFDQLGMEKTSVKCYDGGVDMFDGDRNPIYYREVIEDVDFGEKADIFEWLNAKHGMLVTHDLQFRGCEADGVIVVTKCWSSPTVMECSDPGCG